MNGINLMDLIPSLNEPHRIEAFGFDQADEAAHMISWLGRGNNFRQFVTKDVEGEIYTQTPGAQLLSITCNGPLRMETNASSQGAGQGAVPTDITITFPLLLRIKMPDEIHWELDVDHSYEATNIHLKGGRRGLTQHFTVVGHQQLS